MFNHTFVCYYTGREICEAFQNKIVIVLQVFISTDKAYLSSQVYAKETKDLYRMLNLFPTYNFKFRPKSS